MNEEEGSYEEHRYGGVPYQFAPDETKPPSEEAMQLCRDAIAFVLDIVSNSRTGQAALMRLAVVNSLFDGLGESSAEIARRFNVSAGAVEKLKKEILKEFLGRKFASSHTSLEP